MSCRASGSRCLRWEKVDKCLLFFVSVAKVSHDAGSGLLVDRLDDGFIETAIFSIDSSAVITQPPVWLQKKIEMKASIILKLSIQESENTCSWSERITKQVNTEESLSLRQLYIVH